jgi:hypothetical protein
MTTYNYADVYGHKMFYREAGDKSAPKGNEYEFVF